VRGDVKGLPSGKTIVVFSGGQYGGWYVGQLPVSINGETFKSQITLGTKGVIRSKALVVNESLIGTAIKGATPYGDEDLARWESISLLKWNGML